MAKGNGRTGERETKPRIFVLANSSPFFFPFHKSPPPPFHNSKVPSLCYRLDRFLLFSAPEEMYDDMNPFNPLDLRRTDNSSTGTTRPGVSGSGSGSGGSGSASRQKSCNACVRGKRRCDKTMPRCTRCAAKGLDCVYAKLPPSAITMGVGPSSSSADATAAAAAAAPMVVDADMSDSLLDAMGSASDHHQHHLHHHHQNNNNNNNLMHGFDMVTGLDIHSLGSGSTNTTSPESLALDPNLDFSLVDLIGPPSSATPTTTTTTTNTDGNNTSSNSTLWSSINSNLFGDDVQPPALGKADYPPPVPTRPIRDLALISPRFDTGCPGFDAMDVHDPRTSVGFLAAHMKAMPATFASTRVLPHVHPRLYAGGGNLPRTMLTAFAAASTYTHRSPDTQAWAVRAVGEAAKEVLEEGARAATPLERLARVQASLILDAIRFLDGDVALRAAMDKDVPIAISWLKDLVEMEREMHNKTMESEAEAGGAEGQGPCPPKTWEQWILEESTRRTLVFAVMFRCFACFLKMEIRKCFNFFSPPSPLFLGMEHIPAGKTLS